MESIQKRSANGDGPNPPFSPRMCEKGGLNFLLLVINCGSSSTKCTLFEKEQPIWHQSYSTLQELHNGLKTFQSKKISAIGHRVVHGGDAFRELTLITPEVKKRIEALEILAPLHNRPSLEGIEIAEALFPNRPQFALFDTAFHATLPEIVATYPLPYSFRKTGIRKYGFHGINYSYCSKRVSTLMQKEGKWILCHLGSGASVCAVDKGKSINTSMGMTPLEGLMMGSRSGTLDPGILLYLLKSGQKSIEDLDHLLNFESGLLGISGVSSDMREVQQARQAGKQEATLAIEMFIQRLQMHIGAMLLSLGGLEALVFTGGIGENDPYVREKSCASLSFLGLQLDREQNRSPSQEEREISSNDSRVRVYVIPANEEGEIASQIQLSYRS